MTTKKQKYSNTQSCVICIHFITTATMQGKFKYICKYDQMLLVVTKHRHRLRIALIVINNKTNLPPNRRGEEEQHFHIHTTTAIASLFRHDLCPRVYNIYKCTMLCCKHTYVHEYFLFEPISFRFLPKKKRKRRHLCLQHVKLQSIMN